MKLALISGMKPLKPLTLALGLAIGLTGCYESIGFQSKEMPTFIDEEVKYNSHHPKDNRNYKVFFKEGAPRKFCCIEGRYDEMVLFNKIVKEKGAYRYKQYGYPMNTVTNIKYWNGETFGSIFGDVVGEMFIVAVEVAADEAANSMFNRSENSSSRRTSGKRTSRGSNTRSKSSKSKTVKTGSRDSRGSRSGN